MNTVKVRNIEIGAGIPKICVPIVGKTKEEALKIIDNYEKMINEEEYDKEVLKELLVFDDTSKQPSRIKCATLSANGIKDYLEKENHS